MGRVVNRLPDACLSCGTRQDSQRRDCGALHREGRGFGLDSGSGGGHPRVASGLEAGRVSRLKGVPLERGTAYCDYRLLSPHALLAVLHTAKS